MAIVNGDTEYLDKFMPRFVLNNLTPIQEHYLRVLESPEEDFQMV